MDYFVNSVSSFQYDPTMRASACEATLHKYFASLGPKIHVLPDSKLTFDDFVFWLVIDIPY